MGNIYTEGFALIVGVGADLPNTVDDAEGLAHLLKDTSRCAYPEHQVNLLVSQQATRDNILAGLDQLAEKATPDAMVIVYFSGHGYHVKSSMGKSYYLMPFGYNTSELYKTAISGQEFTQKLKAIPAKKVLILLDCCHAGGVGDAKIPGLELEKSPLPPEAQQLLAEGQGRVLIASSREDELSYAGKPYSAFTLALLEALCGQGVAKKDGYVRVADIALYAREWVPQRTKNRQHPILDYEKADNFVVAYYASGDSEPKRLPFEAESIEVEAEIEQKPQPQVVFNQQGQNVKNQNNIAGDVGSIQNS